MDDNKLLGAIEQLSQSMQDQFGKVNNRFDNIDNRLDSMDKRLTSVEDHIGGMENKIDNLETRTNRVEVLLEHDIPKHIQTLAEGHKAILERLPEADEMDGIRNRLRTLERVVAIHSTEIGELKHE